MSAKSMCSPKNLSCTVTMEVLEFFEEATPKEARQYPHREEEPRLARHPAVGIGREPAARDDAVHVRMMGHGRTPSMQHQRHSDPSTQVLRIGGDRAQRLGGDVEQQPIDELLVGVGDGADRCRQGEDHVVILDGQKVSLACLEPALCGARLALRAVSVAAGVVGDLRLRARRTAQRVSAQGGAATLLDRRHDLQLAEAQVPPLVLAPRRPVGAEDIRDLQAGTNVPYSGRAALQRT